MTMIAMALPILPDKQEQWRSFVSELQGPRREQFDASRRQMGVRERTFMQQTPMGNLVIVTLEGDDPMGAFARFAQGQDEFTQWFLQQVKEVHGVDLSQPPAGPLPELLMDTEAS